MGWLSTRNTVGFVRKPASGAAIGGLTMPKLTVDEAKRLAEQYLGTEVGDMAGWFAGLPPGVPHDLVVRVLTALFAYRGSSHTVASDLGRKKFDWTYFPALVEALKTQPTWAETWACQTLSGSAGRAELKELFRKLALVGHPDPAKRNPRVAEFSKDPAFMDAVRVVVQKANVGAFPRAVQAGLLSCLIEEGSDASIDALLPVLNAALAEKGATLEVLKFAVAAREGRVPRLAELLR